MGYFDPIHTTFIMKMNNFQGDLTDVSAQNKSQSTVKTVCHNHIGVLEVIFVFRVNVICLGYFDSINIIFYNNNKNNLRGGLTDALANTKSLSSCR